MSSRNSISLKTIVKTGTNTARSSKSSLASNSRASSNDKMNKFRNTSTFISLLKNPVPMMRYIIKHGESPKTSVKKLDRTIASLKTK